MNESPAYLLRWRGREFGPCTVPEINRKLDDHEIGLGHEILFQSRWISVEEFLAAGKTDLKGPDEATGRARSQPAVNPSGEAPRPASGASEPAGATTPLKSAPPGTQTAPTELPVAPAGEEGRPHPRRRLVYVSLALLTGFLGLHNFYARHWLTGIIQLLISVASSLLGFGVIAPWIWAMVEAIVVHQDGDEMEMS